MLPENCTFEHFNLNEKVLKAIAQLKIPTEIQRKVIPLILEGKDIMASAPTGSGKTLGFVLPSIHYMLKNAPRNKEGRGPRVLIITPTRELADQVMDTVKRASKFTSIRFGAITGGVPYPAQEFLLRKPLDILVGTPGRLMDHMDKGRVDFSRLEIFILDEADRMLDMGFIKDIEKIMSFMGGDRQTLLFSATLEGDVQKIGSRFMKNPIRVQMDSSVKIPLLITQRVHQADDFNHKRRLLVHVLEEQGMYQAIVFTATKRGAEELVEDLSAKGIECAALHGDMKQSKRTRTLNQVRRGLPVLVATDVAARGLDVKSITHVVNFDLPRSPEDYIHRIGRTGRCGEAGTAISLVGPKDWSILSWIEKTTGQKLERAVISGLEPRSGAEIRRLKNGEGRKRSANFQSFKQSRSRGTNQRSRQRGQEENRPWQSENHRPFERFPKKTAEDRALDRTSKSFRGSKFSRNFDKTKGAFSKEDASKRRPLRETKKRVDPHVFQKNRRHKKKPVIM